MISFLIPLTGIPCCPDCEWQQQVFPVFTQNQPSLSSDAGQHVLPFLQILEYLSRARWKTGQRRTFLWFFWIRNTSCSFSSSKLKNQHRSTGTSGRNTNIWFGERHQTKLVLVEKKTIFFQISSWASPSKLWWNSCPQKLKWIYDSLRSICLSVSSSDLQPPQEHAGSGGGILRPELSCLHGDDTTTRSELTQSSDIDVLRLAMLHFRVYNLWTLSSFSAASFPFFWTSATDSCI